MSIYTCERCGKDSDSDASLSFEEDWERTGKFKGLLTCPACAARIMAQYEIQQSTEDELKDECWYCLGEGTDHKHGDGRAHGDCCAMHGVASHDHDLYKWIKDCITAYRARLASFPQTIQQKEN
jgi:DNA-directed RNA polymerase subunit RPC12/RpoP